MLLVYCGGDEEEDDDEKLGKRGERERERERKNERKRQGYATIIRIDRHQYHLPVEVGSGEEVNKRKAKEKILERRVKK